MLPLNRIASSSWERHLVGRFRHMPPQTLCNNSGFETILVQNLRYPYTFINNLVDLNKTNQFPVFYVLTNLVYFHVHAYWLIIIVFCVSILNPATEKRLDHPHANANGELNRCFCDTSKTGRRESWLLSRPSYGDLPALDGRDSRNGGSHPAALLHCTWFGGSTKCASDAQWHRHCGVYSLKIPFRNSHLNFTRNEWRLGFLKLTILQPY